MNNYNLLFDEAIQQRLQSSQWDKAMALQVMSKVKKRNRLYTAFASAAAMILFAVAVTLWQYNSDDTTNNAMYSFVHAQVNGVYTTVFPEANNAETPYMYGDDRLGDIIETALFERQFIVAQVHQATVLFASYTTDTDEMRFYIP